MFNRCYRFGTVKAINVVKHIDDVTSGEAFAVVDGRGFAMDYKDNLEDAREDNTTYKDLASNNTSEPPNSSMKAMKVDETVKGDAISDDKPRVSGIPSGSFKGHYDTSKVNVHDGHSDHKHVGNVLKDEIREPNIDDRDLTDIGAACPEISDISSTEYMNELNTSTSRLVSNDRISDASPVGACEMENEVNVVERSMLEEDNEKSSAFELDFYRKELDVLEKGENKGAIPCLLNSFEVGCVLVEFKRVEAACMAAHCLHERLFDDRIVTVEYVDPDLYHKKFPK